MCEEHRASPGRCALLLCAALATGCDLAGARFATLFDPDGDGVAWPADCDNGSASVNPLAEDGGQDGVDQDCDGVDGTDADRDGVASEATGGRDCDDGDAAISPEAAEDPYDGVDNDCDADTPDDDLDGDGYARATDCDDGDAAVSPEAAEDPYDGVDNDCDEGTPDDDLDGDGQGAAARGGEDCDDADATVYAGAEERCGDGQVNDCEGDEDSAKQACRATGASVISDAGFKFTGEAAGDLAGAAVAAAGDVDGDGLDDLLVGAASESSAEFLGGAAYLLLGAGALAGASPGGDLGGADLKIRGAAYADKAGEDVAGVGDVDGDGLDDVLIGVANLDSGAADAGGAALLLGGGALRGAHGALSLSAADLTLTGEATMDYAGSVVAGAGDADGDGLADLLVGAYGSDKGGANAGAVWLLLSGGALDGASGTRSLSGADLLLVGEAAWDLAGLSAASAGDVDGDGLADLVIGAPNEDSAGGSAGAAYLALGGTLDGRAGSWDLADADQKLLGEAAGDSAGQHAAGAGDVDGDGRDDLAIGAWAEDSGGEDAGAIYLLLGGGALHSSSGARDLSVADLKLTGETEGDRAGLAVSGAGDVDGDGRADLLIGAPYAGSGSDIPGAAYLLYGGGALLGAAGVAGLAVADRRLEGAASGDWTAGAVAGAGDVNGDGLGELWIGAQSERSAGSEAGAVWLLLGQAF